MSNRYYQQQQQLIHHSASLVQNKYALTVTLKLKGEEISLEEDNLVYMIGPKTRISDQINFIICQSCFWCASCISSQIADTDDSSLIKCPSCIEGNIEYIPIAKNEGYRFYYDNKRGLTMEFLR
jgi:hypothetical protein